MLPSDHFIGDENEFRSVLDRALKTAATGRVTTVGIVPTRPETGYGYIEVGEAIDGIGTGAKSVVRFVEKPDRARAEAFLAGGRHFWNAGMFFFRASDMRHARRAAPARARDGRRARSTRPRGPEKSPRS